MCACFIFVVWLPLQRSPEEPGPHSHSKPLSVNPTKQVELWPPQGLLWHGFCGEKTGNKEAATNGGEGRVETALHGRIAEVAGSSSSSSSSSSSVVAAAAAAVVV